MNLHTFVQCNKSFGPVVSEKILHFCQSETNCQWQPCFFFMDQDEMRSLPYIIVPNKKNNLDISVLRKIF